MSIANLVRHMGELGATHEMIALAVEEVEAAQAELLKGLDGSAVKIGRNGRMTRRAIPQQIQIAVMQRDGECCQYCGAEDGPFHLDHVIPVSRGGDHGMHNLVVACARCNLSKGAKTPEEWAQ